LSFWNFVKNKDDPEQVELRIDGDITMDDDFWSWLFGIETVTPKGFREQLAEHQGKNLTVWINSYGGDVFAASQIYTALKEHKGKVTVKVDGVAISAASVIAMAGKEILMSPTAIMMIHNPWSYAQGESKDMRHAADILDEVKETIVSAYQVKTGRSRNKIAQLMDEETWMGSKKAISEGFADGQLYTDAGVDPEPNAMMFSRVAIQNSAADSMKKFLTEYNKRLAAKTPPPKIEEKRGAPLDLYTKINTNHERRLKNEL